MITVPEATERVVSRSRYLSEAMSKNIINLSSLARYIKPELEAMLNKKISNAAVLMALKRLSATIKPKYVPFDVFSAPPDMIVRSNLVEITVANSEKLMDIYPALLKLSNTSEKHFFTITEGHFESTIIASKSLKEEIKKLIANEQILVEFDNLSAITVRLPKSSINTPGIYYFFLKSLAWEGINIVEIVSAYLELTIVLEEKNTNRAFAVLQSLFDKSI